MLKIKGTLCGSEFLNLSFRKIFAQHIKGCFGALVEEWGCPDTEESRNSFLEAAVKDFEVEKRDFDGCSGRPEDEFMSIHMKGILKNLSRNTKPGRIMISK